VSKQLTNELQVYSDWRQNLHETIQNLSSFLKQHNITDMRTHHQLESMLGSLADDNLSIAFVAEFSRGKSEMINTIFFGNYKQRVLPSGSGRTTMCPTELLYDPNKPTSVRLLPIETRQDKRPLFEIKQDNEAWVEVEFDADDADSITKALKGMTDSKLVSKQYAEKLKFSLVDDQNSEFGLPMNEYDEVEVPSWRHAIINLPHPLLKQGLVILDTPGLNAIGAEPELTINQLATAHTVVFILSNDTGVTKTDLRLWEAHLSDKENIGKLVALNKIDGLWDGIRTDEQIDDEISQQVKETANTLSIPEQNIFPVSAQKGLLGKLKGDQELLERSRILELENAIADRLIPAKKDIVIRKVNNNLVDIVNTSKTIFNRRLKDSHEHIAELKQLSVKNTDVISHIMLKAQAEKSALEQDMRRYQALRAVYSKQTNRLVSRMSKDRLEKLIAHTKRKMASCASSVTLQKTTAHFFSKLDQYIDQAIEQANEIAVLSENITQDFESEHGIANYKIRRLRLDQYKQEVARLESKHRHLQATKTLFFKEQMSITNRFYESACNESRKIFSRALKNTVNWKNNLMIPMETHVREHHTQLRRRLESVKRIHRASDTVEQRLQELNTVQEQLVHQNNEFKQYRQQLKKLLSKKSPAKKKQGPKKNVDSTSNLEKDDGADILYLDAKIQFNPSS